jgi:hypothetical protein
MSARRLARLRAALPYTDAAGRPVLLRRMIAEIEAELAAPRRKIPEERSGTSRGDPGTLRDDALGKPGIVGVQPAAPPATLSNTGGDRPSGASPVADEGLVNTSPEGLLHFLGASDDWRENRRRLRQAGYEVKQYDGAVYVDGLRSDDRSLYP